MTDNSCITLAMAKCTAWPESANTTALEALYTHDTNSGNGWRELVKALSEKLFDLKHFIFIFPHW